MGSLAGCSGAASGAGRRRGFGAAVRQGVGPLAHQGLDKALGLAVGLGGVGPRAVWRTRSSRHTLRNRRLRNTRRCRSSRARPRCPSAGTSAAPGPGSRSPTGASHPASPRRKPGARIVDREWTSSQPAPSLWPRRSPVMRWPMRRKRASFLISRWTSSPAQERCIAAPLDRFERGQSTEAHRRRWLATVLLGRRSSAVISSPVVRYSQRKPVDHGEPGRGQLGGHQRGAELRFCSRQRLRCHSGRATCLQCAC